MPIKSQKLEAFVASQNRRRQVMQSAAESLIGCYASLAPTRTHLLQQLLGESSPQQWMHYPENDVIDHTNGYQYFYHAHAPADRVPDEHGHFHLFARTDAGQHSIDGMQERQFLERFGATPVDATTVNLLCISMDARGVPTHVFTVNRWVTGDRFLDAGTTLEFLSRFKMATLEAPLINTFLNALVQLFWPQIESLLYKRDEKLFEFAKRGKRSGLLESEQTEVLTSMPIDIDRQIMLLQR